jgi:pimeloyl-ACP methyl ester carboxylesterase
MRATAAGLVLVFATLAVVVGEAGSSEPEAAAEDEFSGLITVPDGRRLYLECHGSGGPTVVFEAGLRGRGDIWTRSAGEGVGGGALPRVARFTRACFYDRPGTLLGPGAESRSDPLPMPRSTGAIATDLHDLLGAAGIPGPYVLTGSSTGGLVARRYASRYPGEVAGMVLVDAISEAVQDLMKPRQFARYNRRYLQSPSPEVRRYKDLEWVDFYRSFAEMRQKRRPPRRVPMVVISKDRSFGVPPGVSRRFAGLVDRVWGSAQRYLANLEPKVKHVTAVGSGHQILVNRPALVTRMVLRVVGAIRAGG